MAHTDIPDGLGPPVRGAGEHRPADLGGDGAPSGAVSVDGAIAVEAEASSSPAAAVPRRCEETTTARVRDAAPCGATAEAVVEAAGLAVLGSGGSGTVHAPRAFGASRECADT